MQYWPDTEKDDQKIQITATAYNHWQREAAMLYKKVRVYELRQNFAGNAKYCDSRSKYYGLKMGLGYLRNRLLALNISFLSMINALVKRMHNCNVAKGPLKS